MPVIVRSGAHVVGDFTAEIASGTIIIPEVSSGLHIQISGQHVVVESGIGVIGDFTTEVASGLHVIVGSGVYVISEVEVSSGIGVQIQSGAFVVIESGIGVVTTNVSGQPVTISGDHVYVESGAHVVGDFAVQSGLGVIVQSGVGVVGDFAIEVSVSGQPVTISGQRVVVDSGLGVVGDFNVSSGLYVIQSKMAQLQDYFVSDIDESDTGIKFYGYLDTDSNWYIMQETSGTTYRYASSGIYASSWIDRSGIGYQTVDQGF